MDERALQNKIQSGVRSKLTPVLTKYKMDFSELDAALKWKPIVLILGNYSSGKSTFINELLGKDIQRTGQAPTDDSFTILTSPSSGGDAKDIPGSDLVNDERLPFTGFKVFGEKFISHFRMKQVESPVFTNMALIDSPGMLDSVSEKDRGYDYSSAVKEFAKLADLIVLMFDPHKAGTIQETYNAIRNTLPEATGEDRIIFVMSRIDECDNLGDLVRSYGTLCWNLSQMTGRKDIPRIFLTYSPLVVRNSEQDLTIWAEERDLLKKKILDAPGLRLSHSLQNIDKQVHEVHMVAEAMWSFCEGGKKIVARNFRNTMIMGFLSFFFLDVILREMINFPEVTLVSSLINSGGLVELQRLIIPGASLVVVLMVSGFWLFKWQLPSYFRQCRARVNTLVNLDTEFRRNVWSRVKDNVLTLLEKPSLGAIFTNHARTLSRLENFSKKHIQKYYEKIRK